VEEPPPLPRQPTTLLLLLLQFYSLFLLLPPPAPHIHAHQQRVISFLQKQEEQDAPCCISYSQLIAASSEVTFMILHYPHSEDYHTHINKQQRHGNKLHFKTFPSSSLHRC